MSNRKIIRKKIPKKSKEGVTSEVPIIEEVQRIENQETQDLISTYIQQESRQTMRQSEEKKNELQKTQETSELFDYNNSQEGIQNFNEVNRQHPKVTFSEDLHPNAKINPPSLITVPQLSNQFSILKQENHAKKPPKIPDLLKDIPLKSKFLSEQPPEGVFEPIPVQKIDTTFVIPEEEKETPYKHAQEVFKPIPHQNIVATAKQPPPLLTTNPSTEEKKEPFNLKTLINLFEFLPELLTYQSDLKLWKELEENLEKIQKEAKIPELKETILKLNEKKRCKICQFNFFDIVTSCNHPFCYECYNRNISDQTNGYLILTSQELEIYQPKCPFCQSNLNKQDLEKSTKDINYYKTLANERKPKKNLEFEEKKCKLCEKQKRNQEFYIYDTCQELCSECLFIQIRKGEEECKFCFMKYHFLGTLNNWKVKCMGCEEKVWIISDFTLKICDNHLLCFHCLKTSHEMECCVYCKESLSEEDKESLERTIFTNCEICQIELESPYFISKKCCDYDICGICELNSGKKNCMKCENSLNCYSTEMMAMIENTLEKIKETEPDLLR